MNKVQEFEARIQMARNDAIRAARTADWKTKVFELHVVDGMPMLVADWQEFDDSGKCSIMTGNHGQIVGKMIELLTKAEVAPADVCKVCGGTGTIVGGECDDPCPACRPSKE